MRVGDRIDVMPRGRQGQVALLCGTALWRGSLLDGQAPLQARERVRVLLADDPAGSEGGVLLWLELHEARVVQARDGSRHPVWSGEILQVRRDQIRDETTAVVPDATPSGVPGGVEVVIVGHGGKLELRHEGRRYTAWTMRVPPRLDVGQELHLRLVIPLPSRTDVTESVDVLGCVLRVDGEGRMPFVDGGRFELGITRHLGTALPLPVLDAADVQRRVKGWSALRASTPVAPTHGPSRLERAASRRSSPGPRSAADDTPSGLAGNLEFLSLIEILQSLALGQKTAQVELSDGSRNGTVFLRDGKLLAVYAADLAGEAAFYELAAWTRGTFRVHFGRSTPGENVHHSLTFLVLEHMRRTDEASGVRRPDPLSDSLAGVFKESDDSTDVSPVPEPAALAADPLDFDVVEASAVEIERGTPVEPLRPSCARPEVSMRTPTPHPPTVPPTGPAPHAGEAFASFFSEAAAQRARATDQQGVPPGLRSLHPGLDRPPLFDDAEHPVFGGHSDSNPSPVH